MGFEAVTPYPTFWNDFDVKTERAYKDAHGEIHRIYIPARVLALRDIAPTDEEMEQNDPFGTRNQLATQYALEGDVVDTNIDVWAWGPENTYESRRGYGYETVPDVLNHLRILTPPAVIPSSTTPS